MVKDYWDDAGTHHSYQRRQNEERAEPELKAVHPVILFQRRRRAVEYTIMEERRKKADWPIVITVLLAVALTSLGLYVWGYFALGTVKKEYWMDEAAKVRVYDAEWQATIYAPAARVEQLITGRTVGVRQHGIT